MYMKKRILIPYATYGSGHKTIANYIKNYFEQNGEYECMTLDLINYSVPVLGSFSKKSAEYLMTKLPSIWSFVYFIFDNKLSSYISGKINLKLFDNKKLRKDIIDFDPDITIETHFFGSDIINYYNKLGLTDSKLVTIVTDYKSHDFWLNVVRGTDAIIVSSLEEKLNLLKKGYKNKQVYTSGIPICMDTLGNLKRKDLLKKYKCDNGKLNILFFVGGGNGALINLVYFKELLKNNFYVNIFFVAGRNKEAEKKAKEYVRKYKSKNVKVFGFVNNVNELYKISDVVITKPGGAQVTECILFNKPMILIKSNGGQEIYNRRYLVRNGYAKWAKNKNAFNKEVCELINSDDVRNKMVKNISKIKQEKSIIKLFKIVEKMK